MKFAKILRTPFSIEHLRWWLLLNVIFSDFLFRDIRELMIQKISNIQVKNETKYSSKFCGRQPLKYLNGYGLLKCSKRSFGIQGSYFGT